MDRYLARSRWIVAVALGFTCLGCLGLLWIRQGTTRTAGMGSLVWNLFLAAVPFPLAWGVDGLTRRGQDWPAVPLGIAWLLFFPNAPYLVTDLVHLEKVDGVPLWFDALVFGAFAITGVLLGYVSLYLIQISLRRRFGQIVAGIIALGSIGLGGYGLYLGRVERWNSWDVLGRPGVLARAVTGHLTNPRQNPNAWKYSFAFALFLVAGYVVLWAFVAVVVADERSRTDRR